MDTPTDIPRAKAVSRDKSPISFLKRTNSPLMENDLHALENGWWRTSSDQHIKFPLRSRSFIKSTTQDGVISVTVSNDTCFLPTRWRPIFSIIDICQLQLLIHTEDKRPPSWLVPLMAWYDELRTYIVKEAQKEKLGPTSVWIPDVVHRFFVRLEIGIGHAPYLLNEKTEWLRSTYESRQPWSYGAVLEARV
jgi:hypothetical protein